MEKQFYGFNTYSEERGDVVLEFAGRWVRILTKKGDERLYPSVFVKRVRKKGMVEYRIHIGEKGFGEALFKVIGCDNPTENSEMIEKICKEVGEKGYYVVGDNYTKKG